MLALQQILEKAQSWLCIPKEGAAPTGEAGVLITKGLLALSLCDIQEWLVFTVRRTVRERKVSPYAL